MSAPFNTLTPGATGMPSYRVGLEQFDPNAPPEPPRRSRRITRSRLVLILGALAVVALVVLGIILIPSLLA
jgi:hypothetical protein